MAAATVIRKLDGKLAKEVLTLKISDGSTHRSKLSQAYMALANWAYDAGTAATIRTSTSGNVVTFTVDPVITLTATGTAGTAVISSGTAYVQIWGRL